MPAVCRQVRESEDKMIVLAPPDGVTGTFVVPTGHYHVGPTRCVECAPHLVAMGYRYVDREDAMNEETATLPASDGDAVGTVRQDRRPARSRQRRKV